MRILIVEDDINLCISLAYQLNKEGIETDTCSDGLDALQFIEQQSFDLILLDRMLPNMNGIQILQTIRDQGIETPVILLTALGELYDRVEGLDMGADDYLVKPVAFPELMARIRSIRRRPSILQATNIITHGDLKLDVDQKLLTIGDESSTLSKREADLLELFLKNPEQILPRHLIISRVWGPFSEIEDGNLDNYIHFLRRRLSTLHSKWKIKTKRGVGYCLEEADV